MNGAILSLSLLLPLGLLGACAGNQGAPPPETAGEHHAEANAGHEMCPMCKKKMAERSGDAEAGGSHQGEAPYSCPMHPEQTSDEPGAKCPMCGMDMMRHGGMEGHDSMDMGMNDADPAADSATRRVEIDVVKDGFSPERIEVQKAQPVTLVFTRKTDETCTKEVVVELGAGKKIKRALPLNKPVAITATFATSGKLSYACGMKMNTGVIAVQ